MKEIIQQNNDDNDNSPNGIDSNIIGAIIGDICSNCSISWILFLSA